MTKGRPPASAARGQQRARAPTPTHAHFGRLVASEGGGPATLREAGAAPSERSPPLTTKTKAAAAMKSALSRDRVQAAREAVGETSLLDNHTQREEC